MNNRGMSGARIMTALVSLYILTMIFIYFDPLVEDKIYGFADEKITDAKPQNIIDKYLGAWQFWVPAFLLAIFIFIISAGAEPNQRQGGF